MADLKPAKDIIRAMEKEVQLRTTQEVARRVTAEEGTRREALIAKGVEDVLAATPGMTIDDADQLVSWQEKRESGKPAP